MALSATPAPALRAGAPHSMFSDPRTGRKLVTAFVLARMSLLVLAGRASVNVAFPGHDQDGVDSRCTAGRLLEVVLIGSSDLGTASTRPAHDLVQQRSALPRPLRDVGLRRVPDLQASPIILPQEDGAGRDRIGSPAMPVQAEGGGMPGVRRAGSASAVQATTTTLVVVGLIGLLGVGGAAAFLVHSVTAPVRRAVRVLQAPAAGRLRLTIRDELPDMSGAPSIVEELPTTTGVVSSIVEQATNVRAVAAGITEIAPNVAETRSVLPEIARVVREAAREAAKPATAMTAPSTPTARPVATARYAAARGRALGPTTALWHAVQVDPLVGAIGGSCETTVCGSLVRLSTEETWPVAARDVCPACATLAH